MCLYEFKTTHYGERKTMTTPKLIPCRDNLKFVQSCTCCSEVFSEKSEDKKRAMIDRCNNLSPAHLIRLDRRLSAASKCICNSPLISSSELQSLLRYTYWMETPLPPEPPEEPFTGNSLYDAFVLVLAPTILLVAIVMGCARVIFVYYTYKRYVWFELFTVDRTIIIILT